MGIFVNGNYGLKNNIENTNVEKKDVVSGKISNLPEYVSALKEGSVFKGEILDIRNNVIKILLGSNDILNARTDGSVQLNIGDILNFKVENNTGASMLVKAMSVGNANANNMLLNALQSAEVPVNERNLTLVRELVDNGQPIDKNTVKTLVSNLNSFTELDVDTAVTMFKHDIPINATNVTQFNQYIEQNNKLVTSFDKMSDTIMDTVNEYIDNNGDEAGLKLLNDIAKAISGDENTDITTILSKDVNANISAGEATTTDNANNLLETKVQNATNEETAGKAEIIENAKVTENASNAGNVNLAEGEESDGKMLIKSESLPEQQTNMKVSPELLEHAKDELKKIIKENLFLDKEIFNKPDEDIKSEIENYYKEVDNKADKLLNLLENAGLNKSSLHENVSNVKGNLNFMNDLNNMALYMQIPVRFAENEAHGELYVLNRNRNKTKESDVITAFLHLDMESLGATDVHIRLEGEQLTTKFTLDDSISQDIVEEHLPELKKRLDEKGYTTTLLIEELEKEEVKASPFEQVLMLEEPKNFIKRYTFDVRA